MVIVLYNLIAHRAVNSLKDKENTIDAVKSSLNTDYISGVEIDVRMTKDNKFVVIHDMSINRVSNGSGFVSKMSLKELKKFNFGSENKYIKISTIKDILKIANDKIILIELKYENNDYDKYIKYFYNSIKNYLYKNIYIMSFNYKLIRKLKDTYSNLRCAVLSSTIINRDNIDDDFDFIAISSYSYHTIEDYVRPIFIWALNSKKKYLSLKKEMSNNTYFIVDNPVKFI